MNSLNKKLTYSISASFLVILALIFIQPYSQGYGFSKAPIWAKMVQGYKMEGGEWMFGYFVPLIVLSLIWFTKDNFRDLEIKWSWIGLPIIMISLFLYFGGYRTNEKYIGYVALHGLIGGVVIWHLGLQYFIKGFWLYALWPWILFIDYIAFPLQKIMTVLTSGVLKLLGEDFIKTGTTIMSAPTEELIAGERFQLTVAAACSGLRSFFALAMISLFYGYIILKKDLNRLIIFLSSAVFAVLGNVVRMIMIYAGTLWFGSEFAIGKDHDNPSHYHIGAGLVVFVVALSGMVALAAILERKKKKKIVTVKKGGEE